MANLEVQLLDQLTSYNASEDIIYDFIQYPDCVKDKTSLILTSESIGEDCSMHQVAKSAENWNGGER